MAGNVLTLRKLLQRQTLGKNKIISPKFINLNLAFEPEQAHLRAYALQ